MYDWLYAIPLAILILGSGITYFMSSSLFGPFCIVLSIALIIIIRKRYNAKANAAFLQCTGAITVDELNSLTNDFAELAQCTSTLEKPNAGHCSECNSDWLLSDCEKELDQETWELPPYYIYICPKCKAELDDFWYEEDEESL
ncbi:hypothetical protein KAR91_67170 [Candidatus Pacearchaeota archaeon]|nr:hypothetical protein [Candidatus Pacearchaeota archaeon]